MSKKSVAEILASRAAVEFARVSVAKPWLSSRCERAAGILAEQAKNPRAGAIRAQIRAGELVGYLVKGSNGQVYRVEAFGRWRCGCPDHHQL